TGCFALGSFDLIVLSPDVVYIPDAVFKNQLVVAGPGNTFILGADGLPVLVDVNDDGEIQYSEALLVYSIDLPQFNINTLEGLQHFTNLRRLNMTENNLTSIDLSTLTSLEYLSVNDNNLSVVDITGLTELIEIHIADNMVTELDLSGCPNVEILQVEGNNIPVLDVSGLPNLVNISCAGIGISELDLSNASA